MEQAVTGSAVNRRHEQEILAKRCLLPRSAEVHGAPAMQLPPLPRHRRDFRRGGRDYAAGAVRLPYGVVDEVLESLDAGAERGQREVAAAGRAPARGVFA